MGLAEFDLLEGSDSTSFRIAAQVLTEKRKGTGLILGFWSLKLMVPVLSIGERLALTIGRRIGAGFAQGLLLGT